MTVSSTHPITVVSSGDTMTMATASTSQRSGNHSAFRLDNKRSSSFPSLVDPLTNVPQETHMAFFDTNGQLIWNERTSLLSMKCFSVHLQHTWLSGSCISACSLGTPLTRYGFRHGSMNSVPSLIPRLYAANGTLLPA